jgi:predicted GNAT family acetyltransferase
MPDDIAIEREDGPIFGRWVVRFEDGSEGEMTYRRINDKVIAINHTGVPPHHRGGGIALKLVQAGIDAARAEGFKIVPICSYVEAQFRRHPEWEDLRER